MAKSVALELLPLRPLIDGATVANMEPWVEGAHGGID